MSERTIVVARAGIDPKLFSHSFALAVRARLVREVIEHVGHSNLECQTHWTAELDTADPQDENAQTWVDWNLGDPIPEGTRRLTCRVSTLIDAVDE